MKIVARPWSTLLFSPARGRRTERSSKKPKESDFPRDLQRAYRSEIALNQYKSGSAFGWSCMIHPRHRFNKVNLSESLCPLFFISSRFFFSGLTLCSFRFQYIAGVSDLSLYLFHGDLQAIHTHSFQKPLPVIIVKEHVLPRMNMTLSV